MGCYRQGSESWLTTHPLSVLTVILPEGPNHVAIAENSWVFCREGDFATENRTEYAVPARVIEPATPERNTPVAPVRGLAEGGVSGRP
jgi:hypothetical protein